MEIAACRGTVERLSDSAFPVFDSLPKMNGNKFTLSPAAADWVSNYKTRLSFLKERRKEMAIYIHKNNQQSGPFEEAKILEMLGNGQLSPNDFGIRNDEKQWQPLKDLYPNAAHGSNVPPTPINHQPPPMPQKNGGSKALFILLGLGGLFLVGIIAVGAFIFISRRSVPPPINAANNSVTIPAKTPTVVDDKKLKEFSDKRSELIKLSLPLKLDPKAMINGKVLFVENVEANNEKHYKSGISQYRMAYNLDELETVIRVVCSKGKFLRSYKSTKLSNYEDSVKAYAIDCKVSLIDYRAAAVVAQKTFSHSERDDFISESKVSGGEYLTPAPVGDIISYINSFQIDKVLPTMTGLDEKELLRLPTSVNLKPDAALKGKIKIVERYDEGEISRTSTYFTRFGGDYVYYGLPSDKFTNKPEELETLVKIVCSKGSLIGKVEKTTQYSSKCEVSLIDYKTLSVFAQKIIENKTLDQTAEKNDRQKEWVVKKPDSEIESYLKSFPTS
ncbi:hypothetical protein BH20ACI1_BH20ACI1_04110 [soil metagenome]